MQAPNFDGITRELSEGTTRRSVLRLLGGAVAIGAGAVVSGGASLVPSAEAAKGGINAAVSIRKRVRHQRDMCEVAGGTLSVSSRPGGTTTTCSGGGHDGLVCTNTSKKTRCYPTRQAAPGNPNSGTTVPVITGGGPGPEVTPEPTGPLPEAPTTDPGPIVLG